MKIKSFYKEIGKRLKELREKNNISIEELSANTGIKVGYILKIESAKAKRVKISHVFLLAEGLKVAI